MRGAQRLRPALMSAVALLAGVLAPAAASAGEGTLEARVTQRLEDARLGEQGDIRVAVEDGVVVLDGAVLTLEARREAEKAARKEAKHVENRLRVLPEPRPDAAVRREVEDAILRYPYYTVFDSVELALQDGVVLLRGSVNQPYRKEEIEKRVTRVRGVREIRNEIEVQPVSTFDDRLRWDLYRAIYGDDRFVQYANRVNPPIRIVVSRGRVTLTGLVASRVEQSVLGHIARSSSALGVENRVRFQGETPAEDRRADQL